MKPILFNTEMVRAILDGRKTVTRRVVKFPSNVKKQSNGLLTLFTEGECYENNRIEDIVEYLKQPFKVNDILYVRETWCGLPVTANGHMRGHDVYYYKADGDHRPVGWKGNWRPSIHMPAEAARIFLKVTGVRAERLKNITESQAVKEGFVDDAEYCVGNSARGHFMELWNTTIKKDQLQYYGVAANPYVWVIEFEVIDKAAALKEG